MSQISIIFLFMSVPNLKIHREITPVSEEDSFLVFDRKKTVYDFPLHFHPEIELNFIADGKGLKRIVGDSIEEIDDIELVLIGSNQYHGWEQHKCASKTTREITIQFSEDMFNEHFLKRSIMRPLNYMLKNSSHGILFSKEISVQLYPRLSKVSSLSGIDYYLEMVSILFELATSKNQRFLSAIAKELDEFQNSDKIKSIYHFIHENYPSKITLNTLSNMLNMSDVTFNRFIKKRTGKTFIEYLNDVRVGYASLKLASSDLNISEIAYGCGFNSLTNFNRTFKKYKGTTPTEYRKNFNGIKKVL